MALVTTFLTTPLLHIVYLRKNPIDQIKASMPDTFTTVLAVEHSKAATWMSDVAQLLANVQPQMQLQVLQLREIQDRPTSYFFAEMQVSTRHTRQSEVNRSDVK